MNLPAVPKPDCTDAVYSLNIFLFESIKTAAGKAGLKAAMEYERSLQNLLISYCYPHQSVLLNLVQDLIEIALRWQKLFFESNTSAHLLIQPCFPSCCKFFARFQCIFQHPSNQVYLNQACARKKAAHEEPTRCT